ncbi:uncharacterized protein LOC113564961 [Drosophila persimilis]|uniref:uncharacterized protein LOC113564961 n=1 Tax=Drosophila persimilis TaxID=7234 RepID=UPI000F099052|nr:uncharacterized protein LOC113564961 [Drosophila persimilis]
MTRVVYFSAIFLGSLAYFHVEGSYKFNSLACEILSPQLGWIKECAIKAIDRKRNMLNIVAYLNRTITELQIHFRLVKRESGGWHPFLYDMKVDACMFFRNRRKLFIPNIIYSTLKQFTNVNHSCPYLAGTELTLMHWTPNETMILEKLPVEFGQYGLQTTWYSGNVRALEINGSVLYYK